MFRREIVHQYAAGLLATSDEASAVRDRHVSPPLPVSTLLIVNGFTRAEFLVEVEVTAAKVD